MAIKKFGRSLKSPKLSKSSKSHLSQQLSKSLKSPKVLNKYGKVLTGYIMSGGGDSDSQHQHGFFDSKQNKCTQNQMSFGSSCVTWFTIIIFMVLGALLIVTLWAAFGENLRQWFANVLPNSTQYNIPQPNSTMNTTSRQVDNFSDLSNGLVGENPVMLNMRAPGYNATSLQNSVVMLNQYDRDTMPAVINPATLSIPRRIIQKDYERIINPLLPPERSYEETYGVPINIPSRGFGGGFQQVGNLYKEEIADPDKQIGNNNEPVILPLYGRPIYNGSTKWSYYTTNDKMAMVKLKLESKGQKCDTNTGCDEIYDGDMIKVPPYNGLFKVSIYDFDKPRYIPFAY